MGYTIISYYAKEIVSEQPHAEEGMKNIAIEFTFVTSDTMGHRMRPDKEFFILVGEERYSQ